MNKAELKANVARGVAFLDEKDPQWWNCGGGKSKPAIEGMVGHIDLDKLDMADGKVCILGQRHAGKFVGAVNALFGGDGDAALLRGFNTNFNDSPAFSFLAELWASVIQSRRYPRRKIARDPWVKSINKTWVRV